jgi:serine/threonine protein kinase/Flp pilus assembly protein TadD
MVPQTVSHYRIVSKLGKGGMGEVYKARDLTLGRYVALKFLSEELLKDRQALRRFATEAQAASKLNHPHICTVYEISEHQGRPFIVMELVEGESLKARLERNNFSVDDLLIVSLETTDALAHAHSRGIVHRDIKPANIFMDPGGRVKVLDFGLAKVLSHGRAVSAAAPGAVTIAQTASGVLVGTPDYMSPEQVLGKKLDPRCDLFSVGVVLYEMATGELPFQASSMVGVLDNILNRHPMPPSNLNPAVPPALESIITKALRKDPDLRYQTALEMRDDLVKLQGNLRLGVVPKVEKRSIAERLSSIAVMPFVNNGPNRRDEYLGDGLAEEVINALAQVPGLRVAPRTSAFHFKDKNMDVRIIGEKLNVAALLEGSFRRSRDSLRISVRLIDAAEGYPVWTETYNRSPRDVFAVQEEIALQIVTRLRVQSGERLQEPLARPRTGNLEAYHLYLQGRFHWNKRTRNSLKKSISCFKAAIERDPQYSLAWSGTADANVVLGRFREARSAALNALRADEGLAEAHASLGLVRIYERDWKSAEREFKRALDLNPAYATAHHWYALFLEHAGRLSEAAAEIKRAHELEPLSLIISAAVARIYLHAGELDEALKYARRTIDLDVSFYVGHLILGWIYRKKGMFSEALDAAQTAYELSGADLEALADLGVAHAMAGRLAKAKRVLRDLQQAHAKRKVSAYYIAALFAALGDNDRAFEWIDRLLKEKSTGIADLYVDTRFDSIRSDPRFRALLLRIRPE